jgi:hypothetical protein
MASATGLAWAGEHVWEVADAEERLRAKAEVTARTESTGRRRALARPCVATMPVLASLADLGVYWPGRCTHLLGPGLVLAGSVEREEAPGHGGCEGRGPVMMNGMVVAW